MKLLKRSILLAVFVVSATCSAGNVSAVALLGEWNCNPYNLVGEGFNLTATESSTYRIDGTYLATTALTIRLASKKTVRTRAKSFGNWTLIDDVIRIQYKRMYFLSSDDPTYTVQMGQEDADAQQKKKSWSKAKILELGDKLVTATVESMYKEAEVVVTCVRPSKT